MAKKKRLEEESEVYNALLELIIQCKGIYMQMNIDNALLHINPSQSFVSVLRDLTYGRWDSFLKEYERANEVFDSGNINEGLAVCNKFFDDAKTTPELIAYIGKKLLGLSDDTNSAVEALYLKNIELFKQLGGKENQYVDLLIYVVTLGLIPPQTLYDVNEVSIRASQILASRSYEIGPKAEYINDTNVTSNLVDLSKIFKLPSPSVTSPQPPSTPSVSESKLPQPSVTSPPASMKDLAEILSSLILSHCSQTIKSQGLDVSDIYYNLPLDKIAGQIKHYEGKVSDFGTVAKKFVDYIDCETDFSPYLKSTSGSVLRGAALYNSVASFINKFVQCVGESGELEDKFKKCLEGGVQKSEEEEAEKYEITHKQNEEYYALEGVNDILTKVGQPPFETYSDLEQFITYIGNLMKSYGVTTKDYQKLQTILEKKKSEIEEILDKIPENERKQLLSALANISSLPQPAMQTAISALDKIVEIGKQIPNSGEYYSVLLTLFNNVLILSNNVTMSLGRLNAFLNSLNKRLSNPQERERILGLMAENPNYVIESVTKLLTQPEQAVEHQPSIMPQKPIISAPSPEINLISTREQLISLIMRIAGQPQHIMIPQGTPKPYPAPSITQYIDVYGYRIIALYVVDTDNPSNLESGSHYLIFSKPKEIYEIDMSSEFGTKFVSLLNEKVKMVRDKYKTNVIGTTIEFIYVTNATKREYIPGTFSLKIVEEYVNKVLVLLPKEVDAYAPIVFAYDQDTLPDAYYSDIFVDILDVDNVHLLLDKSRDGIHTIIVVSTQSDLTESKIYKVEKVENEIRFVYWGEYSGKKAKR